MPTKTEMDNRSFPESEEPNFAALFGAMFPLPAAMDPVLEGALVHVLENPGSLVRPRLVHRMASAYGMKGKASEQLAAALEYFHTASLLFDDLPCMDDALERRNAPCTHLLFGQESAILAALALVNRAYALVWQAVSVSPQATQAQVLAFLEQCLGVAGLLNGQSLDLHYSSLPQNRQTTESIARGKTVSLIRLTLVLPAMLGGAPSREVRCLERIALFWGLSYQIIDDLKDVIETATQSGKTSSRDQLLGRPNLAGVLGVEAATQRLARLLELGDRAMRHLLARRPGVSFLARLRAELGHELTRVIRHSSLQEAPEVS
jgi:geranylgeranyl pyrophosphate synthase